MKVRTGDLRRDKFQQEKMMIVIQQGVMNTETVEMTGTGVEILRTEAEILRIGAEIIRIGAEIIRIGAEIIRTGAEIIRIERGEEIITIGTETIQMIGIEAENITTGRETIQIEGEMMIGKGTKTTQTDEKMREKMKGRVGTEPKLKMTSMKQSMIMRKGKTAMVIQIVKVQTKKATGTTGTREIPGIGTGKEKTTAEMIEPEGAAMTDKKIDTEKGEMLPKNEKSWN